MSFEAGNRIKFQHFGQSNYGSKEVGEALRIIEKAMLLNPKFVTYGFGLIHVHPPSTMMLCPVMCLA
jgi:hypothetical protein